MAEEIGIDLDILTWALERVGDDGADGCSFDDGNPNSPDHHGPEFAAALLEAIKAEIAEIELLRATRHLAPNRTPPRRFQALTRDG